MLKKKNLRQKSVAAVHDLSGVGKCSLTVAIPVISAAGIECCPIPTALLSNHTGGFKGFTFKDLTNEILPIVNQWKKEDFYFDAVYSGYLGSNEQVDILSEAIDIVKGRNTLVVIDPVMGDNGALYKSFENDFPNKMKELCKKADVITPNITEACLMLGKEYLPPPYTKEYIKDLLLGLTKICAKTVVLTGVSFSNKQLGVAAVNADTEKISYCFGKKVEGMFHGTGDLFTSVLVSSLVLGNDINKSIKSAVKFTCMAIKNTADKYPKLWYGVNFEGILNKLPTVLGGIKNASV